MMTLGETTDLLDQTTDLLSGDATQLTPKTGIGLIDQWLPPLQSAENTKPIADKLVELKTLLGATSTNEEAVRNVVGKLAEEISTLSSAMGSEGEMPSLLEGLSAAMRQAGETSKAG